MFPLSARSDASAPRLLRRAAWLDPRAAWLAAGLLLLVVGCGEPSESNAPALPGSGGSGLTCDGDPADGGFPAACGGCHGEPDNPAPPPDNWEHITTNSPGVGAHRTVLGSSKWHREVACADCHPVPRLPVSDPCTPTHDNGRTDIVFSAVAVGATYDPVTRRCANVTCHGSEAGEDVAEGAPSVREPQWTIVDGAQTRCGAGCHTLPPGGEHELDTACGSCHQEVIATFNPTHPELTDWVDPSLHINGLHEATVD